MLYPSEVRLSTEPKRQGIEARGLLVKITMWGWTSVGHNTQSISGSGRPYMEETYLYWGPITNPLNGFLTSKKRKDASQR